MNYHGESIQKGATPHCDKCQIKMSWVDNFIIHVQLFTKANFPCEQCDTKSVEANNLSICVRTIHRGTGNQTFSTPKTHFDCDSMKIQMQKHLFCNHFRTFILQSLC